MNKFNENKAVGQLSELLALERGYTPEKARQIRTAAVLHDIGKQGIPKSILDKPSKLTAQEFEVVKTHTKIGARMLSNMHGDLGKMAKDICLLHHEWENGKGYWSIPAYSLPDYVPIVAIVDVYVALIAKRAYKDAWPPENAISYIQGQSGTQFAAELVDVFVCLVRNDSRVPAIFMTV